MSHDTRASHILVCFIALGFLSACSEEPSESTKPMQRTFKGRATRMQIEVLTIPGCQVTPPTVELVKRIATEMEASYAINIVTVDNHGQANDLKFIGSPTVRINGVDIDPDAHLQKQYGVT